MWRRCATNSSCRALGCCNSPSTAMLDNPYLPNNFVGNTVVYTGTHDNATTREWYEESPDYQRQNLWNYLKRPPGESC